MDVELFRALADFLKTELLALGDTVHCFIDEEANRKNKFPAIYLVDIDETRKSFGCGRIDYTRKNPQDLVIKNGKLYNYEAVIRFQVEAPSDDQHRGSEIVADLAKKVDHLFVKTSKTLSKVEFVDPTTSTVVLITGIFLQGMITLPPDIEGKPVIYRRALTYKFVYQWAFEQDVENTFERVLIVYPETP